MRSERLAGGGIVTLRKGFAAKFPKRSFHVQDGETKILPLPIQSAFAKALKDRKTGLCYACVLPRCVFTHGVPNVNTIHPL